MEGAWHVVLRDILVILAAAAVTLTSLLGAVLGWRLYRLARELQADLQPIIEAAQETADTVRGTAGFVSDRMVAPATTAAASAAGLYSMFRLLGEFYAHSKRPGDREEQ
jgi:hypothetical protein